MPPPVAGAAVTSVDLAGSPILLVEVWTADGTTGLAAAPDDGGPALAGAGCRLALGRPASEIGPGGDAGRWPEPGPARTGEGLVAAARADLAARLAGIPLWLWLGGQARPAVPTGGSGPASAGSGRRLTAHRSDWRGLASAVLDRSIDVIEVGPVTAGGPDQIARLDAIARTFQLELLLAAETPLLLSRALAVHLAVTTPTASLPPSLPAIAPAPWLVAAEPYDGAALPRAPGLGLTLDRGSLLAAGGRRAEIR